MMADTLFVPAVSDELVGESVARPPMILFPWTIVPV